MHEAVKYVPRRASELVFDALADTRVVVLNGARQVGKSKSAETVRSDDFRGLKLLQRRLGERFAAGFVLYCGTETVRFGEKLCCAPISALWTAT